MSTPLWTQGDTIKALKPTLVDENKAAIDLSTFTTFTLKGWSKDTPVTFSVAGTVVAPATGGTVQFKPMGNLLATPDYNNNQVVVFTCKVQITNSPGTDVGWSKEFSIAFQRSP